MSHLISKASLLLFLSTFIIQSCTLSIPDKVQTEYSNLTEEIDFNYHIKPILSDRCFQCHGPDSKTRKAGLRFCLLYTSPSPRDRTRSRMPSSA